MILLRIRQRRAGARDPFAARVLFFNGLSKEPCGSLAARGGGLLLLALVFVSAGFGQWNFAAGHAALFESHQSMVAHRDAGLLWYGAMAVAVVVLCFWQRRWSLQPWPGSRRFYAALLVALVAAGAWLRFHRLGELPPGLWVDEALNGLAAVKIAESGRTLVALTPADVRTGLGAGYVNAAALFFWLFDPVDGAHAIRAVAAILGAVGLAGVAALAWVLFGPRAAVVATGWLAISQYHLNFSRWGCMPIMSSVSEVLGVLGLVIGFRCRGWRSWVGMLGGGLALGLGVYTYQTFRLFAVVGGACGALVLATRRRLLGGRVPQLAAAGILCLAVAAPMVEYAAREPHRFGERAQGTLVFNAPDWPHHLELSVSRSLLGFQFVGDPNARHNLPHLPLLSFVPAMLAAIGLMICLYHWRRLPHLLVAGWFLVALLPGSITFEAPHASRLLDAIVPVALMIGIAGDRALATLQAGLPRFGAGFVLGLVALFLGALVTADRELRAYFVERDRVPAFVDAFLPYEAAPGRYLEANTPRATVFLDPKTYGSPTARFLARRYLAAPPGGLRRLEIMHDFPPRAPLERDAVYLLPYEYTPLAEVLRAIAPGANCEEVRDRFGRLDLIACTVAREELEDARRRLDEGTLRWPHGLLGRYYRTSDGTGRPYYEAVVPFIRLDYPTDIAPIGQYRFATWEGCIRLPRSGGYFFRLNPDYTTLSIGGRRIIEHMGAAAFGGGNAGRTVLEAGLYPIRITYRWEPGAPYFLWFFWEPPGGKGEWVPPSALYPPDVPPCDRVWNSKVPLVPQARRR